MQSLLAEMFSFEALAVVLAVAYLLLAARESLWCWYCAFVSSALYVVIFWDVSLLMDSVLNGFYVVMAVIGWQQWRSGGSEQTGVQIISMPWQQHVLLLLVMVVLMVMVLRLLPLLLLLLTLLLQLSRRKICQTPKSPLLLMLPPPPQVVVVLVVVVSRARKRNGR